jgi:NAD(P)-dependent dehydrogenase (short-subunit alcohol dehydrogenase family)
MDLQLLGRRALVTGGSRGIGRAIAQALADEGVRVVIAARNTDEVRDAARAIAAAAAGEVHGLPVDTRDDASVDALVSAALVALGGLDILVNAAARLGLPPEVPGIAGVHSASVLEDLNTKVLGYLRVAKAVAPYLVRNGWGRIINISGLAARSTGSIPGSMRNVAVAALTKELADELGPKGINVTVVHPGPTRTERTAAMVARKASTEGVTEAEAEKRLFGGSLIGRIVDAEEVAAVVAFLASPKSVAINGDAIAAGGGTPRSIYY